ncbi:hypothetical protein GDO81_021015 [Engystomops pustulosus]|uniref:Reverse transcriptase domain-containing protein n=1 Tax=Engystomops pustulosus TaxID=76066 RepID=A0AAV6ZPR3_ENGPU|nr:hypothetical protein GDO81_021015 [Engystomops pustulosus]
MPFGLCNAPAVFQEFVNRSFRDLLYSCVVVYLDNIFVYSPDPESHQSHVRQVLRHLRVYLLYAKLEKYDPETNQWTFVTAMQVARIGAGITSCRGLLYAVGGFDGENRLNTVECYHPENDHWYSVASMKTIRSGAGVVCLDNYLYAAGGYDGNNQLNTVERYNIDHDYWESVASMKHKRSAHGLVLHQGKIYALGGFNADGFLSSIECYCPESNTWTEVSEMPIGCSGMGVAVTMEPCPNAVKDIEEILEA